jgi:lipopolysaccharide biosynthesis glycosyltransferase
MRAEGPDADVDYCVYTRCDGNFFAGLVALLNSLRVHEVDAPIYLIDSGLGDDQMSFLREHHEFKVFEADVSGYALDSSKTTRYTNAVFSGLEVELPHHEVIVHLDADAVLLGPVDELVHAARSHGFAAAGEIPPSNMHTHFWGMPERTGRGLRDISRGAQENAYLEISSRFGPLEFESVTFNSGIWAASGDHYRDKMLPVLEVLKGYHKEIWGLEQAFLNIAAFYAKPDHPFYDIGYAYNSRSDYPYFNEHYAASGYRIAAPRLVSEEEPAPENAGRIRMNGVGGELRIVHFVWRPKPWEASADPDHAANRVWAAFADITPGWRALAAG